MERFMEAARRKAPSYQELFDLSGKVAIVSGAAQGLGLAIVKRLTDAGATVVIADIKVEKGQKAAENLKAEGRKVEFMQCDVRLPADCQRTVKQTVEKFGKLDILVNDAGVFPFYPTLDETEAEWDFVIDTDLKGTFFFSQAAANAMIAKGTAGKIINIASIDGINPMAPLMMLAHYCAAKAGVINLTRALAKDFLKYNINVNCVCPGSMTNAEAGQGVPSRGATPQVSQFILKEGGMNPSTTDEVARVVLIFATPIADQMRGVVVPVDGGTLLTHIEQFFPPLQK